LDEGALTRTGGKMSFSELREFLILRQEEFNGEDLEAVIKS
jgi:hypothetical protein